MSTKNQKQFEPVFKGIVFSVTYIAIVLVFWAYTDGVAEALGISTWWTFLVDVPFTVGLFKFYLWGEE